MLDRTSFVHVTWKRKKIKILVEMFNVRSKTEIALLFAIALPLIVNYLFLKLQVDTFIVTSETIASLAVKNGRISQDYFSQILSLPTPHWSWQEHTYGYITYGFIGSGLAQACLSIISGLDIHIVSYLGIPYFLMALSIYLLYKLLYNSYNSYFTKQTIYKLSLIHI